MEERVQILLSAYADGELSPAERGVVEWELAAHPELQQELNVFQKFDRDVRELPVPDVSARFSGAGDAISEQVSAQKRAGASKLEAAARALRIPEAGEDRFAAIWKRISERVFTQPAADQEYVPSELDATARNLPIPSVDELAWREVWGEIARRTVEITPQERRSVARLETAAASLQAPELSDERSAKAWSRIAARTVGADARQLAVPHVGDERWKNVWSQIATKTVARKAEENVSVERPAPIQADFRPRRRAWSWAAGGVGVAAAAVLCFLMLGTPAAQQSVALKIPEVSDDRYYVGVKYAEGQEQPVVCYYLKEDSPAGGKFSGHWLPEWL